MEYKRSGSPRAVNRSLYGEKAENYRIVAKMWDAYVDAEKRMRTEGPFLLRQLPIEPGRRKVFDAATGTGADSIFLLKNGYEVTSNEFDASYLARARLNFSRENVSPAIASYDWLTLGQYLPPKSFDAVICLGNSLTCILSHTDQYRALRNFLDILKDSGVLILDTRNYDYILDERQSILKSGTLRYSGNYVYCGIDKVHAVPIRISETDVTLKFTDLRSGENAYLFVYPFRRTELHDLIREVGFKSISFFSDYRPGPNPEADFHQFVCRR
jgi:glycine/sarcosine N-methyltransferase